MSLGSTLKEARERKGLTIAQVAEQTRMIHQLVEEIEQDDFHRISAAVYGRGFIKLFAECVDEEAAPLVQEFTEIYSGLRRPGVRTRPVETPEESPEVAEPKDSNAPPPRPKVRAVVIVDDEGPAVEASAPVERPAVTEPPAAPEPPVVPTSGDHTEVERQVAPGRDAPVASEPPATPTDEALAEVERQVAPGRDAPVAFEAPAALTDEALAEVERQATPGRDAPAASEPPAAPKGGALAEVETHEDTEKDVQAADTTLLGELFDFSFRKRRAGREGESAKTKDVARDESSIKISLPQEAPSWDDAPLGESSLFNTVLRYLNIRVVAAVLGGIVLLSAIVFGVVVKRHSKPEEVTDVPAVSQTTTVLEPQPEPQSQSEPQSEPQPEPVPAELSTLNSQLSTPSAPADGKSVYTDNLIPPPDTYVE